MPSWDARSEKFPGVHKMHYRSKLEERETDEGNFHEGATYFENKRSIKEVEQSKLRSLASGFFDKLSDKTKVNAKFPLNSKFPWSSWESLKNEAMFKLSQT